MNQNMLEFLVRMKDLMSGGLAKLASNAKASFGTVMTNIDKTVRKNNELGDSFDKVNKKAQISGSSIAGFGRSLAGFIGIAAALNFGGGAIKSAMEFGATKQSFEVLTGSKEGGNALSGGLNKLQQDTILGPEVFKNAQTMLGFGIGAEKVIPTIKMLGDVSMGNADKMGNLTLAFSQVQAAGKLTGQDLLQFINAGFNPLNEIAKKTGKSIGVLKTEMEKGGISAAMISKAFEDATGTGGLYNNMLNKLAETPYGKMQQLMGAFEALKVKVGEALMPIASAFMNVATFLIDHIEIVGGVVTAWGAYALMTNWVAIKQGFLNTVMKMNPILLLVSLIAGLIVWIVALGEKYKLWGENLGSLYEIIKAFGQTAWIPFKMFGETAWYHIQKLHYNIKDFAESVHGIFGKVGAAWELAKSGNFSGAKEALGASIETEASKQLKALEASHATTQAGLAADMAKAQGSIVTNMAKIIATGGASSVNAAGIKGGGAGGGGSVSPAGKKDSVASGITGGGPRVINISGVTMKVADKMDVMAGDVKQFMQQLEPQMQAMFLRILNSGASVS